MIKISQDNRIESSSYTMDYVNQYVNSLQYPTNEVSMGDEAANVYGSVSAENDKENMPNSLYSTIKTQIHVVSSNQLSDIPDDLSNSGSNDNEFGKPSH